MKYILVAILFVLPVYLFAQEGKFIIKAQVSGFNAPAKAYFNTIDGKNTTVDSATIINGRFEFNGTVKEPKLAKILIAPDGSMKAFISKNVIPVYLQPGVITISGSQDMPANASVTGTELNDSYQGLRTKLALSSAKLDSAREVMNILYQQNTEEQHRLQKDFIDKHPNSPVTFEVINSYVGAAPTVSTLEPLYKKLSEELRRSRQGLAMAQKIEAMKQTSIGSIAPNFTQNDTAGHPVSLSAFRGKYVLIDFWASWCAPCRAENPNVVAAYKQFKDRGFTVLGVSLDGESAKAAWLKAIKDDGLTWTQVSDLQYWNNAIAKLYNVRSIPQNYLISPDGKILAKDLRGEDLKRKLAEILK